MQRRFRLRKPSDFQRVRRSGKSYAHPLIVLIVLPNDLEVSRFGFAAGRRLGKAVQRNRIKRRLREIVRPLLPEIVPGWDAILIARQPITQASFAEVQHAVHTLLRRAKLWTTHEHPSAT